MLVFLALIGLASGHSIPHIVNGRDAKVGEFPWQASLQVFGRHSCGAALVTPRWLISAAHCFGSRLTNTVVLGAYDIKTKLEGNPTEYEIEQVIKHADWNASLDLGPSDIALIKLKKPAVIDKQYVDVVKPAPSDVGDLIGARCIISGWGDTKVGFTGAPNILQAAETTPLSKAVCQERADKIPNLHVKVYDEHICVGADGEISSCHGDSGGPLTCTMEDGSVVLAGVTSGGDSRCRPTDPSIYTRISSFRQWLSDNSAGDISVDL